MGSIAGRSRIARHFLFQKSLSGVRYFNLEDFVARLDHYHINMTDHLFPNETGGAGSFHEDKVNGGWVTDFNKTELISYETQAFHGLEFIILHEVGHGDPLAIQYEADMFHSWHGPTPYIGVDGHGQAPPFWNNESYANNIAAAVEVLLGLTPPEHPPGGFNYVGGP